MTVQISLLCVAVARCGSGVTRGVALGGLGVVCVRCRVAGGRYPWDHTTSDQVERPGAQLTAQLTERCDASTEYTCAPCSLSVSPQVRHVTELPRRINEAFAVATSGRPGPVLVDLPKDIMAAVCTESLCGEVCHSPSQTQSAPCALCLDAHCVWMCIVSCAYTCIP